MLTDILNKLIQKENLTQVEVENVFNQLMSGDLSEAQIAAFLIALVSKGETIEEIAGAAKVMREKSNQIFPKVSKMIDTCGTGGDKSGTFNISTTVGFVVAASGLAVAKHGNRSITSKSGSSDVLEALGVKIDLEPVKVESCIEKVGIGFMFAPLFHPAMKYAMPVRQALKVRTIFNLLGPLTNPANAHYQLLGVFNPDLTSKFAGVLRQLGVQRAMVVHGDGMDEITLTGATQVSELKDGEIKTYQIKPEDFGLKSCGLEDLKGGDANENAGILQRILKGEERGAKREIVILNAGAALYVGEIVDSIENGINLAEELIDSGKAFVKLEEMIEETNK